MIYLGRLKTKEERGNLFFSLLTLCLSCYVFFNSLWTELLPVKLTQELPYNLDIYQHFIEGLLFSLVYLSLIGYLSQLTRFRPHWIIKLSVGIGCAALVSLAVFPLRGVKNFRYVYYFKRHLYLPFLIIAAAVFIMVLVPFLVSVIRKKQYRQKTIIFVITAILIIFTSIFLKKILANWKIGRYFNNWALSVSSLLFSFALSDRFNSEHRDLEELKNDLEKKVEERTSELVGAKDELSRIYNQRTEMFMNLAHETRTPLTLIRYHLEKYLEKRRPDEDLILIRDNILKLQRDMVNFLDSEKIMKGEILYEHNQIVALPEFCREKGRFFQSFAEKKGLSLRLDISADGFIRCDPFALDRVLNNLLLNAVKFTESGEIVLSLKAGGSDLILSVKDTGRGMDPNQINDLFQPFNQTARKKENIQGYGMGLFITRRIVEEMGGRIEVVSEPKTGTEFRIMFPGVVLEMKEMEQMVSMGGSGVLKGKDAIRTYFESLPRDFVAAEKLSSSGEADSDDKEFGGILFIVEDNEELLAILEKELGSDYKVITADGGEEALKKLNFCPLPDLIISDIMMDKGDGEAFFETISADGRFDSIPFMFLTALDEESVRMRAFSRGAVEYIQKPFHLPELKARIASLLQYSARQKEKTIQGAINLLTHNMKNTAVQEDPERRRREIFDKRSEELNLSERQKEIAAMIAEGLEYKEIADKLYISQRTVTRHVQNLYEKLSVHNKVELINRLYGRDEVNASFRTQI